MHDSAFTSTRKLQNLWSFIDISHVLVHDSFYICVHHSVEEHVMSRRSRVWLEAPQRVVVRVAYYLVALLVTIAGWISRQWKSAGSMRWVSCVRRRGGHASYSKGRQPKEPRVLGVVLFQRSFRAQEDQALSRLLVWCVYYYYCCWWCYTNNTTGILIIKK